MGEPIEIDVQEQVSDLIKNLDSARKEGRLCDVTVKVGSHEIPCHKIVLSAGSDYFKQLFNNGIIAEKESGIATGNESGIATWNDSAITTGNESGTTTGNKSDIATGNESGITTGNESGIATGNESGIATGNESGIATGNEADIATQNESGVATGNKSGIATGNKYHFATRKKSGIATGNKSHFAKIEGVDSECMMMCVQYIYTGKVSIPAGKVLELMQAARLLKLTKLYDEVASCLDKRLDAESFFTTKKIANTLSLRKIEESCNNFAKKNFQSLAIADEFKHLEKEYIEFLILSKETEANEAVKCKALLVWTNSDASGRNEAFNKTFVQLNLNKLPKDYLLYLGRNEALVKNSADCMTKLFEAASGTWDASAKDVELRDDCTKKGDENVIAVFDKTSKAIHVFDPEYKSWQRLNDLPKSYLQDDFAAVAIDNDIYICLRNKTNYKLSFADTNASWVRLPDRVVTLKVAAVAFDGDIYAFDDSNTNSKSVEIFDLDESDWSSVCDKPVAARESSVVATGDFICCIGGYNGHVLNNMQLLDPPSGTWTTMPPMPTKRFGAAAAHLDGKIYVAGGRKGEKYLLTFECFDTATESWTTLADMNDPRSFFSACVVHGEIFAVGGGWEQNTIEEFDLLTNTWELVETMTEKNIKDRASVALKL